MQKIQLPDYELKRFYSIAPCIPPGRSNGCVECCVLVLGGAWGGPWGPSGVLGGSWVGPGEGLVCPWGSYSHGLSESNIPRDCQRQPWGTLGDPWGVPGRVLGGPRGPHGRSLGCHGGSSGVPGRSRGVLRGSLGGPQGSLGALKNIEKLLVFVVFPA